MGERVKEIRRALGLTQRDFAQQLELSGPSLSEIETGKFKPGFDLLVKLALEFDINLYYVIFGEGEPFSSPVEAAFRRVESFAVNVDDVRDFLYHFERSPILQYFILNHYRVKMTMEKEPILKETEEYERRNQKKRLTPPAHR